MKHILITIALLTTCICVKAQDFAPVGATWHYTNLESFFWPVQQGFIKIESVKDTIIQSFNCKKLTKTRYGSNGSITSERDEFVYTSGDTVFSLSDNDTFYVLYNWGAQVGEVWTTRTFDLYAQQDVKTTIRVDSKVNVVINGQTLRSLYVSSIGSGSSMGSMMSFIQITETIGGNLYMFPQDYGLWDAGIRIDLRCYNDSTFGFYNANPSSSCEWVISDIDKVQPQTSFNISPNPFTDQIQIKLKENLSGPFKFELYNSPGQLVITRSEKDPGNKETITIPISNELTSGIYYAVVSCGNQKQITKLIKQ